MAKSEKRRTADGEAPVVFEEALGQLEQIVARLEEGQTGLNEALESYEQGVKLLRQCYELLAKAERKVEVLAGFDASGNPVGETLDEREGESLEEKAAARSQRRSQATSHLPRQPKPLTEEEINSQDIPF